jgi:hypothetical protein
MLLRNKDKTKILIHNNNISKCLQLNLWVDWETNYFKYLH